MATETTMEYPDDDINNLENILKTSNNFAQDFKKFTNRIKDIINSNDKSTNQYYNNTQELNINFQKSCLSTIDRLNEEIKENSSEEFKKYCIEEIKKILNLLKEDKDKAEEKMNKKDTENKHFNWGIAGMVGAVIGFGISAICGKGSTPSFPQFPPPEFPHRLPRW